VSEPETEEFRSKLRDLAEAKLRLYLPEMGPEFFNKLVANKANWRAGYCKYPGWGCYGVFPQTAFTREVKGEYIVGPFTALKWTKLELEVWGVL
jgi:hypothetical protein